jgi:D-alanine-D-alanine ligase
MPYPLFVKPANLGSSIGINRADDRAALAGAIDVAAEFDRRILIEQGLDRPTEVNCSALGFGEGVEASVCEMPVAWQEFLSFEDKYLRGGKGQKGQNGKSGMASLARRIPAPISEKMTAVVRQQTIDIFKIMDLKGVVRVDYMIDNATGRLYVNEVNTIPGSLAFYLWEPKGLIFARLIDRMVACALEAQRQKEASNFTYDSSILVGYSGKK